MFYDFLELRSFHFVSYQFRNIIGKNAVNKICINFLFGVFQDTIRLFYFLVKQTSTILLLHNDI
jgi:hypothetical protein